MLVASLDPIRDSLASALVGLQAGPLNAQAFANSLPLIGNALAEKPEFQFLANHASEIDAEFVALGANPSLGDITTAIAAALQISQSEVIVTDDHGPINQLILTPSEVADRVDNATRIEFSLRKQGVVAPTTVAFKLGESFSGLGLDVSNGAVDLRLTYDLPLAFGVDTAGFYASLNEDLHATVNVTPSDLKMEGSLGLLKVSTLDEGSGFVGSFNIQFIDGLVRSDFASIDATVSLVSNTDLRLRIIGESAGTTIAPKLETVLNVDWDFTDEDVEAGAIGNQPVVSFSDITISRESMFQGLVAPYVNEIEKVVRPLKDLADLLLDRPIDILPVTYLDLIEFATKGGGDLSLQSLLNLFSSSPSDLKLLLTRVKSIGAFLEAAKGATGGAAFQFGDFSPLGDIRSGHIAVPSGPGLSIAGTIGGGAFGNALSNLNRDGGSTFNSEFTFDLLEDTSNVFKLLTGDPSASLVSYSLSASYSVAPQPYTFTTLVGILPVEFALGGTLSVGADLRMGYDATGFASYKAGGFSDASKLLDGIYVHTDTEFRLDPSIFFTITAGITPGTILNLIRQYTGISIPGWVLSAGGVSATLAVEGKLELSANVAFSVADVPGSTDNRLHFNELSQTLNRGMENAFDTAGIIEFKAGAKFIYGIEAQLPGKKLFDALGIGKFVEGAKFEVSNELNIIRPYSIVLYNFDTDSAGARSDLSGSNPAPPNPTITVVGATAHPTEPDVWLVHEGATAQLTANPGGLTYSWRQLTNEDFGDTGTQYHTPPVKLASTGSKTTDIKPLGYSLISNPQAGPFFSLLPIEDRYAFELTVTDPATGLSATKQVKVVGLDVNPTVGAPISTINGVNTGHIGVRGFDLDFRSTFSDPGDQVPFDTQWNFGDPGSQGNLVELNGITPDFTAARHAFSASGTYTVSVLVDDGFYDDVAPPALGTTTATASLDIKKVFVLPDQADANKTALYVGGTPNSEAITLHKNPATGKIRVTMPDFDGEFDIPTGHIYVNGYGGDDTILFDFTGGHFLPSPYVRVRADGSTWIDSAGAVIDGGEGDNKYHAIGGSFAAVGAAFFPNESGLFHSGFVDYDDIPVSLLNIHSVTDVTSATQLSFSANTFADQLLLRDGVAFTGVHTSELVNGANGVHGSLTFANKTIAIVSGGAGADTFTVRNATPAEGLVNVLLFGNAIDDEDDATDTFNILEIAVAHSAFGEGGDDLFNVGVTQVDNNGNLSSIGAIVTLRGQGGTDRIYVNDHGNERPANYLVTPTAVRDFSAADIVDATYQTAPRSTFAGIDYDGTTEHLHLDATDAINLFEVQPSIDTQYVINGNLPATREVASRLGDFLRLNTEGTDGRKIDFTPPKSGNGNWTFSSNHRDVNFLSMERFNHVERLAVASEAARYGEPLVKVYDAETRELLYEVMAYATSYRGGVRVATADVDEDGIPDVITAPGKSEIYKEMYDLDGNGRVDFGDIAKFASGFQWQPGQPGFEFVWRSDINGSNRVDMSDFSFFSANFGKSMGSGATFTYPDNHAPIVKVFDGLGDWSGQLTPFAPWYTEFSLPLVDEFPAYDTYLSYGVNVAVGDINGDYSNDIVTAPYRGESLVRVFENKRFADDFVRTREFVAYPSDYIGGVNLAVADFNGDGKADIVTAPATGYEPLVQVFSGANLSQRLASFYAFEASFRGGVSVAVGNVVGNAKPDIVVGAAHGGNSRVRVFDGSTLPATLGQPTPAVELRAFTETTDNTRAPVRVSVKDHALDGIVDEIFASQSSDGKAGYVKVFGKQRRLSTADTISATVVDQLFENDLELHNGFYLG